jgi:hypothetical protein
MPYTHHFIGSQLYHCTTTRLPTRYIGLRGDDWSRISAAHDYPLRPARRSPEEESITCNRRLWRGPESESNSKYMVTIDFIPIEVLPHIFSEAIHWV